MRKIVLLAALLVVCPTLALAAPSAQKKALIDELMRVSNAYALGANFLIEMILMAVPEKPSPGDVRDARQELADSPETKQLVQEAFVRLYDRNFTEAQLRELIAFFKSDLGKKYAQLQMDIGVEGRGKIAALYGAQLEGMLSVSKAKRTMADLRTLATASEAYATDVNAYPDAKNINEVEGIIRPVYIRTVPKQDAWGKPYAYATNENKDGYRFVSGGPDGKIDPANLKVGGKPSGTNDDIVFENGEFVQSPASQ